MSLSSASSAWSRSSGSAATRKPKRLSPGPSWMCRSRASALAPFPSTPFVLAALVPAGRAELLLASVGSAAAITAPSFASVGRTLGRGLLFRHVISVPPIFWGCRSDPVSETPRRVVVNISRVLRTVISGNTTPIRTCRSRDVDARKRWTRQHALVARPLSALVVRRNDSSIDRHATLESIRRVIFTPSYSARLWEAALLLFGALALGGLPSLIVTHQPWWYGGILTFTGLAGLAVVLALLSARASCLQRRGLIPTNRPT